MIEIRKVEDPSIARKICEEKGVEYRENYHVIATIEGENILHSAVFSYEKEVGNIYSISGFDGDTLLLDGLCRAILNIMDIQGVKVVYLSEKYSKLASYVGFSKDGDEYKLNLEGFFNCSCSSKKGK